MHFYKTSGLNDLQPPFRPFRTNTQKDALFIIGDWNEKVGSQETPGVNLALANLALEYGMKQGKG